MKNINGFKFTKDEIKLFNSYYETYLNYDYKQVLIDNFSVGENIFVSKSFLDKLDSYISYKEKEKSDNEFFDLMFEIAELHLNCRNR